MRDRLDEGEFPWPRLHPVNEGAVKLHRMHGKLSLCSADDLAAVVIILKARPQKTLDWRTRMEARNQVLHDVYAPVKSTQ